MVSSKASNDGTQEQEHSRASKRTLDTSQENSQPDGNIGVSVKRSRVSRACDQCRAGRERCDGSHPKCQTCSSQNRACSYNEQPKKRGIQPNYIRTLELALAWLFQSFPAVESRLATGLPVDQDHARELISGKDPATTEALHLAWRNCLVNKQIDQMLSGTAIEKDGQSVQGAPMNADSLHMPYNSPPLSAPSEHSVTKPVTNGSQAVSGINRAGSLRQQPMRMTKSIPDNTRYQLPENAWTLLEYYFAFTHSWLPMTEKHSMLKLMYSYPPEGVLPQKVTGAEHAELWAIMALTASQMYDEESRSEIRRIYHLAEGLIPTGDASYELPHIKAMILLALTDAQEGHMLAAWLRIGSVVRLLYLFKLLQSIGQVTKWCRHIHLVAFILESALALHLRVFGHLRASFIEAIGFVDEDGMDEWAPWQDPLDMAHTPVAKAPARAFSTLNELVRVCLRSIEGQSMGQSSNDLDAATDSSIIFALLRNATAKLGRVQPFRMVAAHGKNLDTEGFDWSLEAHLSRPTAAEAFQPEEFPNLQQQQAFVSIPNEASASTFDGSPTVSNAARSSTLWTPDVPINPNFQSSTLPDGIGEKSIDIFEELAALERQDSMQHPQFMRNLGFAPDLDLAEFFGADYQPSDPLLAYLQPTNFDTVSSDINAEGYL